MRDDAAAPNSIPWPPILTAAAVAAGWALGRVVPFPWPEGTVRVLGAAVGLCLVCAAVALVVVAARLMARHRTTILPTKAATTLLAEGPFARSRNPIYVADVMVLVGLGLLLGEGWMLVLAPLLVVALTRLAIEREERHLAATFGPAFEAYRAKVPRWL